MQVIAVANQKGGVGKTAVTASLAAVASRAGLRVLAVDADPQYALTRQLHDHNPVLSLADVLMGNQQIADVTLPSTSTSAHLVPASRALASAELGLVTATRREERLVRALRAVEGDYDLAIVDSPPNLGTLTVNALAAADLVLIPVSAEDEGAVRGVGELMLTLSDLYDQDDLPPVSLVVTKWDRRRETAAAVADAVQSYDVRLIGARIPSTAMHHKAPMLGMPVAQHKPDSKSGLAYTHLFDELALELGLSPAKGA